MPDRPNTTMERIADLERRVQTQNSLIANLIVRVQALEARDA